MSDVDAFLRQQIARVRGLANASAEIAAEAVKDLRQELERQVARAETPAGERWQPTQAGDAPLTNAAAAVAISSAGPVILYRISGPEAMHHLGRGKGRVRRQVIPDKVESNMAEAIKRAADRVIARRMGG